MRGKKEKGETQKTFFAWIICTKWKRYFNSLHTNNFLSITKDIKFEAFWFGLFSRRIFRIWMC